MSAIFNRSRIRLYDIYKSYATISSSQYTILEKTNYATFSNAHYLRNVLFRSHTTTSSPSPRQRPNSLNIPGVSHIVAVASGKGGVGKSTTTVNLAIALAKNLNLNVGVLDADIYGPSIPKLLNLHQKPYVDDDERLLPLKNHSISSMSMGYLMDDDAAAVWRGPMVISALQTFIKKVNWGNLDVLLIDMPPGTGDAQITISQQLALSGAIIVTTPQDLALIDARRGVTMFRKVQVPILGIVENMSCFVCGVCGAEAHIFGQGGAERTAEEMDLDVLGKIPLTVGIRESSDDGNPIVSSAPESQAAHAYVKIAELVWSRLRKIDELRERSGKANGVPSINVT